MKGVTISEFEEWVQKLKDKKVERIWHSLGTHIWIDLGDVFSEELGANGFYKMYEYTIHSSRRLSINRDGKIVISNINDSNKSEIDEILKDLSSLKLRLIDIQIFEKTIKIILTEGFEVQIFEADIENFETDISFREENKSIIINPDNTIQLTEYDEPIQD